MTILRNFLLSMALVSGAESLADDPFEERIRPFLQTYCIACHGEETQKGKIRLDHLRGDMEDRKEAELWARSLEAIEFGEMPSDKADKFPTKAQARLVQDWIAQSLDRVGRKVEDKAGKEGYGNLIPHDLLFSPAESKRVVNAAARLWRISPKALADIVRGARMVSNPFVLDKPQGNFRDFKGKYAFNSLMAEQVTELALAHSEKEAKNARKAIVMMKEKGITIDEANREAIKRHCHNVLRRTPSEKEMVIMMGLL
ncbi:MAG: c-type cytochrome domain-containing protein [Verrucomicrobiota bacterium]|nr:c-type cytochrome domain-containing protein [Verrucomicrobiota bacterium]